MKILGIDYGRKKTGLAVSEGTLADPWLVIRSSDKIKLLAELKSIIEKEKVEKVVVGISEGEMGSESKNFAGNLQDTLSIPVETFDETLTSKDAMEKSIEAGIKRKKRREMEDAYAAAIMLQNYIDLGV